jgi:hypothetical protein
MPPTRQPETPPDAAATRGPVLALYGNVTFVADPDSGEPVTTSIRIMDAGGARVLEHAVGCGECKTRNWVVVGTDPGEYRCVSCCGYL